MLRQASPIWAVVNMVNIHSGVVKEELRFSGKEPSDAFRIRLSGGCCFSGVLWLRGLLLELTPVAQPISLLKRLLGSSG